jgi:hypothetical protein
VDPAEPDKTLTVELAPWPADDLPFTHEAPIKVRAKARRIPNWTLDRRGLVREVIGGPVRSNEPLEDVTWIPMGAAAAPRAVPVWGGALLVLLPQEHRLPQLRLARLHIVQKFSFSAGTRLTDPPSMTPRGVEHLSLAL